jgi:LuxR family maltose regulon positive regulatory protein
MCAVTRATAWILERSPQRCAAASELLVDVQRRAESMKLHNVIVQALLVQALLHRSRGQDDAASGKLRQALAVAERAGYVRTVVDLGAAIRPLLEWHARRVGSSPYLERLLSQFRTVRHGEILPAPAAAHRYTLATSIPPVEYESLTEREVDVLLGLQRRLSNKEIADELSISPLTIKTHTRNIYGKLGVNSRRQAIARALELGLLTHI